MEPASGGLTPHETLQVVTIFSAEAIGLQQDVGSLEAGKLADLLVLDRNPLENIRNTNSIRYVMKNGELYEGDTLNMVWPRAEAAAEAVLVGHGAEAASTVADRQDSDELRYICIAFTRLPHGRRGFAKTPSERFGEVAVAREAEVERDVDQVDAGLGQPLERRAQPQLVAIGVQRKAGARLEDPREVEHRRLRLPWRYPTATGCP